MSFLSLLILFSKKGLNLLFSRDLWAWDTINWPGRYFLSWSASYTNKYLDWTFRYLINTLDSISDNTICFDGCYLWHFHNLWKSCFVKNRISQFEWAINHDSDWVLTPLSPSSNPKILPYWHFMIIFGLRTSWACFLMNRTPWVITPTLPSRYTISSLL